MLSTHKTKDVVRGYVKNGIPQHLILPSFQLCYNDTHDTPDTLDTV